MKAYMAYSRSCGPHECATLVFANNAKEAKKLAWIKADLITDEYTDLAISWIKNMPWVLDQMISDVPHVIESPISCENCLMWGLELNDDGICEGCQEEME